MHIQLLAILKKKAFILISIGLINYIYRLAVNPALINDIRIFVVLEQFLFRKRVQKSMYSFWSQTKMDT